MTNSNFVNVCAGKNACFGKSSNPHLNNVLEQEESLIVPSSCYHGCFIMDRCDDNAQNENLIEATVADCESERSVQRFSIRLTGDFDPAEDCESQIANMNVELFDTRHVPLYTPVLTEFKPVLQELVRKIIKSDQALQYGHVTSSTSMRPKAYLIEKRRSIALGRKRRRCVRDTVLNPKSLQLGDIVSYKLCPGYVPSNLIPANSVLQYSHVTTTYASGSIFSSNAVSDIDCPSAEQLRIVERNSLEARTLQISQSSTIILASLHCPKSFIQLVPTQCTVDTHEASFDVVLLGQGQRIATFVYVTDRHRFLQAVTTTNQVTQWSVQLIKHTSPGAINASSISKMISNRRFRWTELYQEFDTPSCHEAVTSAARAPMRKSSTHSLQLPLNAIVHQKHTDTKQFARANFYCSLDPRRNYESVDKLTKEWELVLGDHYELESPIPLNRWILEDLELLNTNTNSHPVTQGNRRRLNVSLLNASTCGRQIKRNQASYYPNSRLKQFTSKNKRWPSWKRRHMDPKRSGRATSRLQTPYLLKLKPGIYAYCPFTGISTIISKLSHLTKNVRKSKFDQSLLTTKSKRPRRYSRKSRMNHGTLLVYPSEPSYKNPMIDSTGSRMHKKHCKQGIHRIWNKRCFFKSSHQMLRTRNPTKVPGYTSNQSSLRLGKSQTFPNTHYPRLRVTKQICSRSSLSDNSKRQTDYVAGVYTQHGTFIGTYVDCTSIMRKQCYNCSPEAISRSQSRIIDSIRGSWVEIGDPSSEMCFDSNILRSQWKSRYRRGLVSAELNHLQHVRKLDGSRFDLPNNVNGHGSWTFGKTLLEMYEATELLKFQKKCIRIRDVFDLTANNTLGLIRVDEASYSIGIYTTSGATSLTAGLVLASEQSADTLSHTPCVIMETNFLQIVQTSNIKRDFLHVYLTPHTVQHINSGPISIGAALTSYPHTSDSSTMYVRAYRKSQLASGNFTNTDVSEAYSETVSITCSTDNFSIPTYSNKQKMLEHLRDNHDNALSYLKYLSHDAFRSHLILYSIPRCGFKALLHQNQLDHTHEDVVSNQRQPITQAMDSNNSNSMFLDNLSLSTHGTIAPRMRYSDTELDIPTLPSTIVDPTEAHLSPNSGTIISVYESDEIYSENRCDLNAAIVGQEHGDSEIVQDEPSWSLGFVESRASSMTSFYQSFPPESMQITSAPCELQCWCSGCTDPEERIESVDRTTRRQVEAGDVDCTITASILITAGYVQNSDSLNEYYSIISNMHSTHEHTPLVHLAIMEHSALEYNAVSYITDDFQSLVTHILHLLDENDAYTEKGVTPSFLPIYAAELWRSESISDSVDTLAPKMMDTPLPLCMNTYSVNDITELDFSHMMQHHFLSSSTKTCLYHVYRVTEDCDFNVQTTDCAPQCNLTANLCDYCSLPYLLPFAPIKFTWLNIVQPIRFLPQIIDIIQPMENILPLNRTLMTNTEQHATMSALTLNILDASSRNHSVVGISVQKLSRKWRVITNDVSICIRKRHAQSQEVHKTSRLPLLQSYTPSACRVPSPKREIACTQKNNINGSSNAHRPIIPCTHLRRASKFRSSMASDMPLFQLRNKLLQIEQARDLSGNARPSRTVSKIVQKAPVKRVNSRLPEPVRGKSPSFPAKSVASSKRSISGEGEKLQSEQVFFNRIDQLYLTRKRLFNTLHKPEKPKQNNVRFSGN